VLNRGPEEVAAQGAALTDRALAVFEICSSRASSLEVFSEAAAGCRARTATPQVDPVRMPAKRALADAKALARQAIENPNAETLEALGLAYLQARELPLAQLTFGRVTELEERRAVAHNGLGLTYLLLGEPMEAGAAYARALEVDPTNEKARANLAALRCRFGDTEGAKKELSALRSGRLEGFDVDPGWSACR
jgi:Flp pilus assembly protein TadD